MSKVRIEIDGEVYESHLCGPNENACTKCVFFDSLDCELCLFCDTHLGNYGYFEKSFDEILLENKDVLHRLKMGIVPAVPQDDDSEYVND